MSITIKILPVKSIDEIYCHYSGQTSSQGVYIDVDCRNETLSMSYNGEIGNAIPFSVYHGHDQRFAIPLMTIDRANEFLQEIEPLAQRIIDGYDSEWDGNNMVARFNDDATEALNELETICNDECENSDYDNGDVLSEWDVGDYYEEVTHYRDEIGQQTKWDRPITCEIEGIGTISENTSDEDLNKMESKMESNCLSENIVINGTERWLEDIRNQCRENAEWLRD